MKQYANKWSLYLHFQQDENNFDSFGQLVIENISNSQKNNEADLLMRLMADTTLAEERAETTLAVCRR